MKLIGHRGAKLECPENTMAGIEWAYQNGLDGVEIDVHVTKDDVLAVIHDATIDRTTNGKGPVRHFSFNELRNFQVEDKHYIPRLEEVLTFHQDKAQSDLFIEIKDLRATDLILEVIAPFRSKCHIILKCFNHRILRQLRDRDSEISLAALIAGLPLNPVDMVELAGANILSLSALSIDQKIVDQCHQAGIKVCVWNANSVDEIRYFESLSVDWVCTDRPSLKKSL